MLRHTERAYYLPLMLRHTERAYYLPLMLRHTERAYYFTAHVTHNGGRKPRVENLLKTLLLFVQGIGKLTKYDAHPCEFALTDVIARRIDDRFSTAFTTGIANALCSFQIEDSGVTA